MNSRPDDMVMKVGLSKQPNITGGDQMTSPPQSTNDRGGPHVFELTNVTADLEGCEGHAHEPSQGGSYIVYEPLHFPCRQSSQDDSLYERLS